MDTLNKDTIQLICNNLHINDAITLKMVCKSFNSAITMVTLCMYSCAVDKNNLPLKSNQNCLKLQIKQLKHKININTLKKSFFSDMSNRLSFVIWGKMIENEQLNIEKNLEDIDVYDDNESLVDSFIPITILIRQKISFLNEGRKIMWGLQSKSETINNRIIVYLQKQLRYIQSEAWLFSHSYTTNLVLLDSKALELTCVAGEILDKTIIELRNILLIFGFTLYDDPIKIEHLP